MELSSSRFHIPDWYKWSRDPLHHWSRVWEYPWVFQNLKRPEGYYVTGEGVPVLDVGSGITFFDTFMRLSGFSVDLLDYDLDICKYTGGLYATIEIPLTIRQYQNVVCISVVEHLENPAQAIQNLKDLVAPGGRLIMTMDVGLDDQSQITPKQVCELADVLEIDSTKWLADLWRAKNEVTTRTISSGLPGSTRWWKKAVSTVRRGHPLGHIPYLTVCGFIWDNVQD